MSSVPLRKREPVQPLPGPVQPEYYFVQPVLPPIGLALPWRMLAVVTPPATSR